jgi:hypothetical protein
VNLLSFINNGFCRNQFADFIAMLNDALYICLWQYNKDIYSPTFSLGPLRVFLYSGYCW